MLCPICQVELVLSERQGIEIDYCPKCRGVWLDRGELDKIIERAHADSDSYASRTATAEIDGRKPKPAYPDGELPYDYDDDCHEDRPRRYDDPQHRRRKSFLDDVFDIFD